MKLLIEIDVDNEDVQTASGLALVLDEVTRSVVAANDETTFRKMARSIKDGNGNTVGRWQVVA